MMSAATYTGPVTLTQFQHGVDVAAMAARFRRRCPAVNLDDIDAIPPAFVRELTDKLSERCLANGLGEMMVTNHATHVQVLDEYRSHLAIVRELMGDLVQKVMTRVTNLRMELRDYMFLSGKVIRAGLFAGKDALLTTKTILAPTQGSRVHKTTSVRANDITAVQVNADTRHVTDDRIDCALRNGSIHKDGCIVPFSRLLANRNVLYRSVERTVQHSLDVLALRNGYRPVRPVDSAVLRIVKRLSVAFAFRERVGRAVLPPVPETVSALLDGILQGLGIYLANPWIDLLQHHKLGLRRKARHAVAAAYPVHGHIVQRTVVGDAYATEALRKEPGLFRSGIKTVFVRPQHITNILKFPDKNKRESEKYEQISFINSFDLQHLLSCSILSQIPFQIPSEISEPVDTLILRGIRRTYSSPG